MMPYERKGIERPLLFGHGAGAAIACAVATRRIPRCVVLAGEQRSDMIAPMLVVTEAELLEAGRLAERVAAFDRPLD
jgi:alpha-beta hydrolase superfamily lysophospholipase